MGAVERVIALMERTRPSEMLMPMAYGEGMYFLSNNTLGAVFRAPLLAGGDERTQSNLTSALNEQFPPGTIIQFIQIGVPNVDPALRAYEKARAKEGNFASDIAKGLAAKRAAFMREGTGAAHLKVPEALTLDLRLYITVQIPFTAVPYPSEEDQANFNSACEKFRGALDAAHLRTDIVGAAELLSLLRRYYKMYGKWDEHYDEEHLLRDQVVPPGSRLVAYRKYLRISVPGEPHMFARTIAFNRFPRFANLGFANSLAGDVDGLGTQIGVPFALCTTIHIPEQSKKISKVRSAATLINNQAFGPMLKWVPVLRAKKEGHDCLGASLERRQQVVEVSTTMTVFGRNLRALDRKASQISAYYTELGGQAYGEQYLVAPTFYNQLPLQASPGAIAGTHRFKTMAAEHAAQFLPVLGDWSGFGEAMVFHTRRQHPFRFDFFDSRYNSNFNWMLFAESGAGKSFLVERIILDYLSLDTQLWVIDKGKSHTKLTVAAGGQVIEFDRDSTICLNPFTRVTDIEEDIGMLTALVCKMAAPRTNLDDAQEMRILEAIQSTWNSFGSDMSIQDVIEYLSAQSEDEIAVELARRLFSFSRNGPYGSWFIGQNNLEFNAPIVTLELKGLEANEILQEVVLLQLMITVQQGMFRGDDSKKKMMIAEECGDLLKNDAFSKFVAALNSKIRKHNGSMGIVMQSLTQLYNSKYGEEIASSASTKLIMQQKGEAIETARRERWIDIPDAAFGLLKTVQTRKGVGGFSEVAFLTSSGMGIARLIESRFNQVLFSTEGAERTEILAAIDRGENVIEAIEHFIAERG